MGATPSRENTILFSYFRGTYEVGLIPLTRHFFGRDDDQAHTTAGATVRLDSAPSAQTSTERPVSFSRAALRAQLIQAREDPAMRYAIARDTTSILSAMRRAEQTKDGSESHTNGVRTPEMVDEDTWSSQYWTTMPDGNFTEDDLDRYLDVVDQYLYDTDKDMIDDPRYAGKEATLATPTSDTRSPAIHGRLPRAFVPIPCALCLTYQEGKSRPDSLLLNGRQTKIIGFFGLFTRDMHEAFHVVKHAEEGTRRAAHTGATTDATATTAHASSNSPTGSRPFDMEELTLHSAILSSAGDRTLERVLILASVVLRQLFHTASWRVSAERGGPRPQPAWCHPAAALPIAHFLSHTLPPAPYGCFRLNMETDAVGTEPAPLDLHALQSVLLRPAPLNTADDASLDAVASAADWAQYRRLAQLPVCTDTAGNNYGALKSLAENMAFLHTQILLDPAESDLELIDMPHPQPDESPREPSPTSSMTDAQDPLSASRSQWLNATPLKPNSSVTLHVRPHYFAQAAMWAGCLFHAPTLLCDHQWVQYKLKDECEQLRCVIQKKDTLIAAWRRRDPIRAAQYMGPRTATLLHYIQFLQGETEEARNRPLEEWQGPIFSSHGRHYAMHRSPAGVMLVGVRGSKPQLSGQSAAITERSLARTHPSGSDDSSAATTRFHARTATSHGSSLVSADASRLGPGTTVKGGSGSSSSSGGALNVREAAYTGVSVPPAHDALSHLLQGLPVSPSSAAGGSATAVPLSAVSWAHPSGLVSGVPAHMVGLWAPPPAQYTPAPIPHGTLTTVDQMRGAFVPHSYGAASPPLAYGPPGRASSTHLQAGSSSSASTPYVASASQPHQPMIFYLPTQSGASPLAASGAAQDGLMHTLVMTSSSPQQDSAGPNSPCGQAVPYSFFPTLAPGRAQGQSQPSVYPGGHAYPATRVTPPHSPQQSVPLQPQIVYVDGNGFPIQSNTQFSSAASGTGDGTSKLSLSSPFATTPPGAHGPWIAPGTPYGNSLNVHAVPPALLSEGAKGTEAGAAGRSGVSGPAPCAPVFYFPPPHAQHPPYASPTPLQALPPPQQQQGMPPVFMLLGTHSPSSPQSPAFYTTYQ